MYVRPNRRFGFKVTSSVTSLILFVAIPLTYSQSSGFNNSNQQWVQYYFQYKFNDNWSLGADAGFRWRNLMSEPSQYIARLSCWYKLKNGVKLGGGFVHSGYFSHDVKVGNYLNASEMRPYQELGFDSKKEKYSLAFRYRLEERFFAQYALSGKSGDRFLMRNRISAGIQMRLWKISDTNETALFWYLGDELFILFNTPDATHWYDQNRVITGPVLKLSDDLSLQFFYNMQVSGTSTPNWYNMTHVAWFSVRQTLGNN